MPPPIKLLPGRQLRGPDRPRERRQRVVRLQPVPGHGLAQRDEAVQRRRRRGRRDRGGLLRRRRLHHTIGSPSATQRHRVGGTTQDNVRAGQLRAGPDFATTGWSATTFQPELQRVHRGRQDDHPGRPGDISVASCTPNLACTPSAPTSGHPQLQRGGSGGTSESAPFVSGVAADIIQAYRKTHGGANPTRAGQADPGLHGERPRLPGQEQGAGLVNAYKAVLLAESVKTADGAPRPAGAT